MKRRTFLIIAGLGGGIAAVTSVRIFTRSFEDAAGSIIKKELSFLKLDEAGVANYVTEYSKNKDRYFKLTIKGYGLLGISSSKSGKIHQLVSNYLLSSDFFVNKMDESRVIRYVAFYDPYARPCAHPFSHLQYPGEAT